MKRVSTQSTLLACLVLSASAAFVSSCQDYEPYNDQHLKDVAYTHEFERQFGKIDPNQNWDLFGQLARKKKIGTRVDDYWAQVNVTPINDFNQAVKVSKAADAEYDLVLPEQPNNAGYNIRYEETNLGRVVQDFVATAHEFTVAPVHWTTSGTDEIGIYWYTDEEGHADRTIMGQDGELYWLVTKKIIDGKSRLYYVVGENETPTAVPTGPNSSSHVFTTYNADHLLALPINVQVPEDIPFYGFYIRQGNDWRYSEAKLNTRVTYTNFADKQPCFVATFNIQRDIDANYPDSRDYLCFEDWMNGGDFDLNDLVFTIDGFHQEDIIDQTTVSETAVLVCEDLKEFDFDFNDIALELNYTEETNRVYKQNDQGRYDLDQENTTTIQKLEVTAMAAGGWYESTVSFKNGNNWSYDWGEIHYLLGEDGATQAGTNSKKHAVINAGKIFSAEGLKISFPAEGKPLPEKDNQYPTYLSQLFATDFFTIISKVDGAADKIISNGTYKGKGEGTAPQMMLLPKYFEWPQEGVYINDTYSGFSEWVADVTKTDWILNSQDESLITDRGDLQPVITPDVPTEITDEKNLTPVNGTIQYSINNTNRTYYAQYLDLSGIQLQANDHATAKLHIKYASKPASTIHLVIADANGDNQTHLLAHQYNSSENYTEYTYSISEPMFLKALQYDHIWIFAENSNVTWNQQNESNRPQIDEAIIEIHNVTAEAHHKLFVDPHYMTFENTNVQEIYASSSTGAIINYTSSDESIAKVEKIDNNHARVTPMADGYASIVVRAEASTVNGKEYKSTSERVSVEVIMGSDTKVILRLGATQHDASAQDNLTEYALCTTARIVMDSWNNGATLTVAKTAGGNASFQIQNADGSFKSATKTTDNQAIYVFSYDELQQFKNSDNSGYTFKILHTDNTYIQSASLQKN